MDGPVLTRSRLVGINGKDRVRSAVVENLDSGRRATIECDTVVFTGDWIPDHELARTGGLEMDPATRGPLVDAGLRTSSPGVFAVGNLLHPGRHRRRRRTGRTPRGHGGESLAAASRRARTRPVRIRADAPFRWVAPQLVSPDGGVAARGDLLFWVDEYRRLPKLGRCRTAGCSATSRTPWPAAPGRVYRAPWSLVPMPTRTAATSPCRSPDCSRRVWA